jgi:hypothetical protein
MLQVGERPILLSRKQSPPRTTKAKLASLLHAAHQWWEMPTKDPEVPLTTKLGLQHRILQEQSPGMCVQVLIQKGAQSGHWHSPCQWGHGKLAGANKAKEVSQVESPTPNMSLLRLPFLKEHPFY